MRDYKFRGKRLDTGEWVTGCYIGGFNSKAFIFGSGIDHNTPRAERIYDQWEVDPTTIGQFIGRRDKHERDVYQDDIVQSDEGATAIVTWEPPEFLALAKAGKNSIDGWCTNVIAFNDFAVIGNTHDTPNPLEATSNE